MYIYIKHTVEILTKSEKQKWHGGQKDIGICKYWEENTVGSKVEKIRGECEKEARDIAGHPNQCLAPELKDAKIPLP